MKLPGKVRISPAITRRARLALPAAAVALAAGVVPAMAASPMSTGGWRVVATLAGAKESLSLGSVVAFSPRDAWAAGGSGMPQPALVLRWAGNGWHRALLPVSVRRALTGGAHVVASSAADVWIYNQSHWARWNGTGWRTGRIPRAHKGADAQSGQLLAFGRADAWFIGEFLTGGNPHPFAEHFNGRSWRAMPAPPITDFALSGASSAAICAVNDQFGSSMTATTILACWNGRRWHRLPLPAGLGGKNAIIGSILVRSLRDIWVGGGRLGDASGIPGLAAHLTGSRWRLTILPAVATLGTDVLGLLVGDGHGGLWARGDCECGGPAWRLWHYTGGRWIRPALPAIGGMYGLVSSIAAVPGTSSAWAVGTRGTRTGTDGVILAHGRVPK